MKKFDRKKKLSKTITFNYHSRCLTDTWQCKNYQEYFKPWEHKGSKLLLIFQILPFQKAKSCHMKQGESTTNDSQPEHVSTKIPPSVATRSA